MQFSCFPYEKLPVILSPCSIFAAIGDGENVPVIIYEGLYSYFDVVINVHVL